MLVKCNDTGGLDDLLPEPQADGATADDHSEPGDPAGEEAVQS